MTWLPTTWLPTAGTHIAVMLGLALVGGTILWVLGQRRSPQSALAWIFFIVTLPYVGVPLFFGFGVRRSGMRYDPLRFAPESDPPAAVHDLDTQIRAMGLPAARAGHQVVFETTPIAARASTLEIVDSARESLDIALYRLDRDSYSEAFVAGLIEAARRGVRVRVLLDQLGTWRRPRKSLHALAAAGGDVRLFAALPQLLSTGRLNFRNHRKMIVADGRRAWTGGRNIGASYLGEMTDPGTWTDLSMRIEGPLVAHLAEVFAADWGKVAPDFEPDPPVAGTGRDGTLAQLLPSGPDLPHDALHDLLVRAIHRARRRVWIMTPYFLPTDQLEHALATAARLNVDLRLLVPAKSNQPVADFARGAYLRALAEAGGRVLRFRPGMLHAKAFIIDDTAWVGSANLDVRSMLLNFEAMVMFYGPDEVAEIADWFETLSDEAEEGPRPVTLPRRIAEATFRLGAPIL